MTEEKDNDEGPEAPSPESFIENIDYYTDAEGLMVLTAKYLLRRGFCCHQGCRHCPYPQESPKKAPS